MEGENLTAEMVSFGPSARRISFFSDEAPLDGSGRAISSCQYQVSYSRKQLIGVDPAEERNIGYNLQGKWKLTMEVEKDLKNSFLENLAF